MEEKIVYIVHCVDTEGPLYESLEATGERIFNTFGLSSGSNYTGLALDSNNIIIVFIFLFEAFFSTGVFTIILYLSCLMLAALNVSQIKTPKLNGNPVNVYILAFYTLGITGIYGWKLL